MKTIFKILLICLLLAGCGARKVQKTTEDTKQETTETVKIDENKAEKTETKISENSGDVIIEPVNPNAEMIVEGKTYKNARLRRSNKKVSTNIIKEVKEVKTAVKQVEKSTSREIIKKDIERTAVGWAWWLLLLLVIPIYYLYRKYKHLIWFV